MTGASLHRFFADMPPPASFAADWASRAAAVIPGGASTGSKRPFALYGSDAPDAPTHYRHARGCEVTAADGRTLLDFTSALGSVALGYADPAVGAAVCAAVAAGSVSSLPSTVEVELAERLCAVLPGAERVRFLKSGAEAVQAAVRLARAATGRELVIGSGYFGWLDWWTDAPGVPAGVRADFRGVPFDDVSALDAAVRDAGTRLAAIVLEPVQERLPSAAWIAAARSACDATGAVLVFDEVKTGFRLRRGGYQELSGVTADVSVFGKALANGWPLAAVVGRAAVMDEARRTWISSTLAGESTALAAALAVLDHHEERDVCAQLAATGAAQLAAAHAAVAESHAVDVEVVGLPVMWFLRHADPARETRVLETLARDGVLLKRGAYNFPTLAHDAASTRRLRAALAAALAASAAPARSAPSPPDA